MKSNNLSVYLVFPNMGGPRHRERMLMKLDRAFLKLTVVSYLEGETYANSIKVKAPRNWVTIFAKIGLPRVSKVLNKHLYFPSPNIPRVNRAEKLLQDAIRVDLEAGHDVCVVIFTPPHDFAILGYRLKHAFPEIRLLVDWQDLWSFDESYFLRVSPMYRNKLLVEERKVFDACDLNIVSNFKAAEILENHFALNPAKISSFPHPFDPIEQKEIQSYKKVLERKMSKSSKPVKIGFLGIISKPPKVQADIILEGIDRVICSGLDLEVHIYGDQTKLTRKTVNGLQNTSKVILHERITHLDSLKAMAGCDFLLIALADLPNCNVIMHAKLSHYLIVGRPILAIVPENSYVAHVVRETQSGVVIPTSIDWENELRKIVEAYNDGSFVLRRNEVAINKYSWNALSDKWLEAITGSD